MDQEFVNVKKASAGAVVRSANSKPFGYKIRRDDFGKIVTAGALKRSAEALARARRVTGD